MSGFSWVTLATNDSYSLGALVLAHSLKRVGTVHQLVVMVTPGVTQLMREKLQTVFDLVSEVNILDSKDERNLLLLQRPELGITFTKLHCWRLTQYKKCVFLDADTLVLQNCDELFDREEFSAAPDVGWPDCFNSGVFVYKPSDETFNSLLTFALERGSFDGGDQGLLNLYFSDWAHKDISKHLPFIYNMCSTACYSYLPAFKQFGENVKIVHFIGNSKPWLQYFNSENLQVTVNPGFEHMQLVFEHWWQLFCSHVHSGLQPSMGGLAGAFAQMTLNEPKSASQNALEDHLRRQGWEAGRIDYLGQDSFDNVWKKICETISAGPRKEPSPPKYKSPEMVEDITEIPTTEIPGRRESFAPVVVRAAASVTSDSQTESSQVIKSPEIVEANRRESIAVVSGRRESFAPVVVRTAVPVAPNESESTSLATVTESPTEASSSVISETVESEATPDPAVIESSPATVSESTAVVSPPTEDLKAAVIESVSTPTEDSKAAVIESSLTTVSEPAAVASIPTEDSKVAVVESSPALVSESVLPPSAATILECVAQTDFPPAVTVASQPSEPIPITPIAQPAKETSKAVEAQKDVSKTEEKPAEAKKETSKPVEGSSESASAPVPPPRKSGKNGGASAKKTSKKK